MTPDPVALLLADRARAAEHGDSMASLCAVASVDQGEPEVRTLVLRLVGEPARLAVFCNATSPKFRQFATHRTAAVLVYLPSVALQYRLRCALEAIPPAVVHAQWQQRPSVPKRMDWLYQTHPQSTAIASRERLEALLGDVALPDAAPDSAVGYYLLPEAVDRLHLDQPNGIHDRRRYVRDGDGWTEATLVP